MEEEIQYDTIRVYDAVNNIYYDKQVPHVEPVEPEPTFEEKQAAINDAQTITNNEQDEINIDLDYRITMLELGL